MTEWLIPIGITVFLVIVWPAMAVKLFTREVKRGS